MTNLWRPDDGSFLLDTFGGFNVYTLAALLELLLVVVVVRAVTMRFSPALLRRVIRSESITNKTVRDSDKSLGVAAGAGLALVLLNIMLDDRGLEGSPVVMPDLAASLLPSILQFVVAVAVVMWAIRLVDIVQDVVMLFDDDEKMDGTERTLISALQSTLRFIIILIGAVFVADSMGLDLNVEGIR